MYAQTNHAKLQEAEHQKPLGKDEQIVTAVRHWTDNLFSFRVTRPQSLRFRSGEFVMIGLEGENGKPLLRAYSIASPSWDEELEFFSIKVPDGPLTSRLQKIQVGDRILLKTKPTGTLVLDALIPGKRLFMFSTGTGIAPFRSFLWRYFMEKHDDFKFGGKAWLFLGVPTSSALLYDDEFKKMKELGGDNF